MRDCKPSGTPRGELVEPIASYVERVIMPSLHSQADVVTTFDDSREESSEALFASQRPTIGLDIRSQYGLLIILYGPNADYYCIEMTDGPEVTVTLDLYSGLRP